MKLHPVFRLREKFTPEIVELLKSVVLGSNGTRYRHKDTEERIQKLDNPLFLSVERNEKVLGNVTFCRRNRDWYIRFFAFANRIQSSGKKQSTGKDGFLKKELNEFFGNVLTSQGAYSADSFYAYIDPKNSKSLWMSQNFGLEITAFLATQTFSRVRPKFEILLNRMELKDVQSAIESQYTEHRFFHPDLQEDDTFYGIRDHDDVLVAAARVKRATWEFERLPGRMGGWLINVIPYVPFLRKLLRPQEHTFLVLDSLYINEKKVAYWSEKILFRILMQGILHREKLNVIHWWVDEKDPLYRKCKSKVKWGLLHRMIGVTRVAVVERKRVKDGPPNDRTSTENRPVYVRGVDLT